jgi:crotonobetainyl-CoA:carnitine CoA-transferase CaiB-like acyl-CoA transferase
MPPLAGGWSYRFAMLNRNKKSAAINLKTREGRDLFLRMAQRADAILETFRPGVMERLGLDYNSVRAANPKIIYCSLSGYGPKGPYRERVGHDLNYIGLAGLLSLTGKAKPEIPGAPVADLAGAMFAALTLLAALQRRAHTGTGAYLDLAMTDTVFSWLTIHLAELFATGVAPTPTASVLLGAFPCYAIYETADGQQLTVGALEPKFWQSLCIALGRPHYTPHQFNSEIRDEIFRDLRGIFKTKTCEGWLEFFSGDEVPVAPVNNLARAVADPQILHRRLVQSVKLSGEEFKQVAYPAHFEGARERPNQPPPRLGQNTREVLLELGCGEEEIEALRLRDVIAV